MPAALYTPSSDSFVGTARLTDIGLGGAMIETSVPVLRRVPYELRWEWRGQAMKATGRVAWEKAGGNAHRYGLSLATTSEQERLIRRMIDDLRQQLWSGK